MFKLENFEFSKNEVETLFEIIKYGLKYEASGEQRVGFLSGFFSTHAEIIQSKNYIKQTKNTWVREWSETVSKLLDIKDLSPDRLSNTLRQQTSEKLRKLFDSFSEEKKICFLTEVVSFTAYYRLTDKDSQDYSKLKFEESAYLEALKELLTRSNFNTNVVALQFLRSSFFECVNDFSKYTAGKSSKWIWMGVGALILLISAPYLAGVIGGFMGLSGAAAVSAGLAFLGGGSLAAGGFGMVGGYFALMAGGMLFGYKAGDSQYKSKLIEVSSENLLIAGAKLFSAISFFAYQNNFQQMKNEVREICSTIRMIQTDLEAKIDEICLTGSNNEKEVAELRKKSRIIERLRFRLTKALKAN
jgi:cell division protein FtsL